MFEECDITFAEGELPIDCEIIGAEGSRVFNNTDCDNTLCISQFGICDGTDEDIQCCCQDDETKSFSFTCPASGTRTIFQPASCSCRPCGNFSVSLIFVITSGSNSSAIMGAEIVINNGSSLLVTDALGIANTNRPVSDVQVLVEVTADNHANAMFTVEILPPGPTVINVVLSPEEQQFLGNSGDNLTFSIGSVAIVDVPANTIVDGSGNMFDGNVTVQTVFFAVDNTDSYSDIFPPEVVTGQDGNTIFYQSRVIARTQLFDENGAQLNINPATSINVVLNFSLFDQSQNLTLSLLLYDDQSNSWSVDSDFIITTATTNKRQTADLMTAIGPLSDTQLFWAVGLSIDSTDIVYLQVRINSETNLGATIDVEQFTNNLGETFFFRSSATIGDGSGPIANSLCIEVLRSTSSNGTIQATFEEGTVTPSVMQPTGFTVAFADDVVRFTGAIEGAPGGPIYATQSECMDADDSLYVSFEPIVAPPTSDIPPEDDPGQGFWYIQAQVLSCFDSNRVSSISVDTVNEQASIVTRTATATPGAPIVSIPSDINPSICTGTVTARTVCLQAFPDTSVTIQAEQNLANTANGNLCYLRAASDQIDSVTTDFTIEFDLATVENTSLVNDASLGIYFDADSSGAALVRCLNSVDQPVPLGGSFVQFECFERELTVNY